MRRISVLSSVIVVPLLLAGCEDSNKSAETDALPSETLMQANHNALSLPRRLAFMSGHVEAGLALYRAGDLTMAAPHLLHPVSETHAVERAGLDALGFEANLFAAVSKALDEGVAADKIEPQLIAAQRNLIAMADRAGGDPAQIIEYLMDTVLDEYAEGVTNGKVTNSGEYQDAFGFTKVAIARARDLNSPNAEAVLKALTRLLDTWPEAPIPPDDPADLATIEAHVAAVRRALSGNPVR